MPASSDLLLAGKAPIHKSPTFGSPVYTTVSSNLPFQLNNSHVQKDSSNPAKADKVSSWPHSQHESHCLKEATAKQPEDSALVKIDKVDISQKEAFFSGQIELDVVYTVERQLKANLSWRVIYLGSAYSERHDQDLCEF